VYYQRVSDAVAWVYPDGNIVDRTLGPDPFSLFGTRNLEQIDLSLRGIVTFTRTLSVQFFLQSFVARGEYHDYTRLLANGMLLPYPYERFGFNHDFNTMNFNANVLMRWEYLPGSALYLVWTQSRFGDTGDYGTSIGGTLGDTWAWPRQDAVVLKVNYRFSL
jgi:hypothetical protein